MTIAILDKKYLFLLLLYTLQFVPAGFFYGAIPAILGANNVPMSVIGWVYMMGLIWVGKFLWAPYIDKFTFSFFQGHYRAWLIVIQILLSISMFITAFFPLTENFLTAIILIGIINFISSTQDIAVDGLAINSLRRDQLEYANSMQTVGIFIGTLIGLGLPLYSYEIYDWKTTLIILSLVVLIPTLALNFYKENPKERDLPKITFLEIYKFLKEKNGFKILIMIIPGYWIVERSFPLVQQLLIKNNWSLIDIVISQNIIGSFTGIIGAIIAGSVINKYGKEKSYLLFSIFIIADVGLMIMIEDVGKNFNLVTGILAYNYFCLGLFMTTYFTYIMTNSSKEYAGTHVNIQHGLLLFISLVSTKILFTLVDSLGFKSGFIILGVIFCFSTLFLLLRRWKNGTK